MDTTAYFARVLGKPMKISALIEKFLEAFRLETSLPKIYMNISIPEC
jgi:hypothetical protein